MHINANFDYPLAAFAAASSARASSRDPGVQHLADAVGHLAQAIAQQNQKIDALLVRQAQIFKKVSG